jgi:hypothetical protein
MSFRTFAAFGVVGAALFASACNDDGQPCDPNQILKNRVCVLKPVPDAGSSQDVEETDGEAVDGEVVDGEIGDSAPEGGGGTVFGRTCLMSGDSAECMAPAPYCAVQPGATMGYCTTLGCKADMSLCPPGWMCFVIAAISLDFCAKP